jgi:PAS domain S-box-containing protein
VACLADATYLRPTRQPSGRTLDEGGSTVGEIQRGYSLEKRILAALPEAVVAIDLEHKIIFWSLFAQHFYGWRADEVIGRDAVELLVEEQLRPQARQVLNRLQSDGTWDGEFTMQPREGRPFAAAIRAEALRDERGVLVALVGFAVAATPQIADAAAPPYERETAGAKETLWPLLALAVLMSILSTILLLADRVWPP